MNIPIEILWIFFALTVGLVAIGYIARFSVPISLFIFIAGGLLMALFVLTDNIILNNEVDVITIIPQNVTTFQNQTVNTYSYFVESRSGMIPLDNVNFARTEVPANGNSDLLGDTINCIDLFLQKSGSPTGTAEIGILGATNNVIKLFGTQDVSLLVGSSTWYSYCLTGTDTHTIASGERIGIKYTGGSVGNTVGVNNDNADPFDGADSTLSTYTTVWTSTVGSDITARFYLQETELVELTFPAETQEYEYAENNYPFTEEVKVFMLLISVIMILVGGAVEIEQRKR